jgi:hypothetical protein
MEGGRLGRLRRLQFGRPRDVAEAGLLHRMSLVAVLAWIGLGADGLSSSAYGPEEAYRHLQRQHYLAPLLALATAITVGVIACGYVRVIEHFPHGGGGGNVVASKLLGAPAGVVSGAALRSTTSSPSLSPSPAAATRCSACSPSSGAAMTSPSSPSRWRPSRCSSSSTCVA